MTDAEAPLVYRTAAGSTVTIDAIRRDVRDITWDWIAEGACDEAIARVEFGSLDDPMLLWHCPCCEITARTALYPADDTVAELRRMALQWRLAQRLTPTAFQTAIARYATDVESALRFFAATIGLRLDPAQPKDIAGHAE